MAVGRRAIRVFFSLFAAIAAASAADATFTGTWKADMQKSKLGEHPPLSELVLLEQTPAAIKETVGETSQRGEYRASYAYTLDGKESENTFRGLPMKSKVALSGETLTIESRVAGPHGAIIRQKYTLGDDGKTLEIVGTMTENGNEATQTIVLDKQPDSAGEALRRPEKIAAENFKNVKLLKELPASHFIDTMRYFSASLGVDCEHCHVKGHFDSDDKKEKRTARKMIEMTGNIDKQTFNGKAEVRCYTCHQGNKKPVTQIPFSGQQAGS